MWKRPDIASLDALQAEDCFLPVSDLVEDNDGLLWLLKYKGNEDANRTPRDHFSYLLGTGFVNVAEVRRITDTDLFAFHDLGYEQAQTSSFLCRLARQYKTSELPYRTLESATAGELVFSLLIRRRDAHAKNRQYNDDGIPVFYDFDIAFGTGDVGNLVSVEQFFNHLLGGNGYPDVWRVYEVPPSELPITTAGGRAVGETNCWHKVQSLEKFKEEARRFAQLFVADARNYHVLGNQAGLTDHDWQIAFPVLVSSHASIIEDTEFMIEKVSRPLPDR